jgi:stage II sporulation protein D
LKTALAAAGIAAILAANASSGRVRPGPAATDAVQGVGQADGIRIGFLRNRAYEVETLSMEPYVARVLAGEAARESPPAALEALAIAIRTYATANRGRHRAEGFDLCDQTHCQVVRTATAVTERAVENTAGQILRFAGEPATIFYSASCGGRSERPSSVWPGIADRSYLPVRPDDACEGQPQWSVELRLADLQRALQASGFRGTLRGLRIASRNDSGRVAVLALDGLEPREISGQDLRMALIRMPELPQVRSASFEMSRTNDGYRLEGHGYGHGVGMCVIGSVNLAARGVSAADILQRYFPGTAISGGAGPVVTLPAAAESERAALVDLAGSARDALAKRLGVAAPTRIVVHVQPSSAEYERVSGRRWFTFGSLVNGELHLLPISMLRERGMLELTVRRQLVRAMTEPQLAGKPLWVREGVALHFAALPGSSTQSPAAASGACPADDELARPLSPGALSDAYARARGCVERQLRNGRSWREIR